MGFAKLDEKILDSSVWSEDYPVRIVWITMLAMSDKNGLVRATAPGISRRALVTIEECRRALDIFESPDLNSRTPDNEGRRIKRVDGGYLILNYLKYRAWTYSDNPEAIRQRKYRDKKKEEVSHTLPKERNKEEETEAECRDMSQHVTDMSHTDPPIASLKDKNQEPRINTASVCLSSGAGSQDCPPRTSSGSDFQPLQVYPHDQDKGFQSLWSAYPHPEHGRWRSRQDLAFQAYQLALKRISLSELMLRVEEYRKEMFAGRIDRLKPLQYWLTSKEQGGYEDFVPVKKTMIFKEKPQEVKNAQSYDADATFLDLQRRLQQIASGNAQRTCDATSEIKLPENVGN